MFDGSGIALRCVAHRGGSPILSHPSRQDSHPLSDVHLLLAGTAIFRWNLSPILCAVLERTEQVMGAAIRLAIKSVVSMKKG